MDFYSFQLIFGAKKGQNGPKIFFSSFLSKKLSNDIQHQYVLRKTKNFKFQTPKCIFYSFQLIFGAKKGQNGPKIFFSSFLSKELSNDIQHKCVLAKTQDFKISVILELFYPFWPIFRPKKGKMTRKYFFRNSCAILHPTRGHMPMF